MKIELPPDVGSIELLQAILLELRGLRGDLAERRAPGLDAALCSLLQAIHDFVGSDCRFSAAELIAEADETLRQALGEIDAQQLARLLVKLEGVDVDGLRLVRIDRGRKGVTWAIQSG